MDSATYHALNLTCAAASCGALGLIFGYGWGCEATRQAFKNAAVAREAARVKRFKTLFEEGVKQKKVTPKEGVKLIKIQG